MLSLLLNFPFFFLHHSFNWKQANITDICFKNVNKNILPSSHSSDIINMFHSYLFHHFLFWFIHFHFKKITNHYVLQLLMSWNDRKPSDTPLSAASEKGGLVVAEGRPWSTEHGVDIRRAFLVDRLLTSLFSAMGVQM